MRDFRYGYEPYHRLDGDLPDLPPVSHMELGRQEPLIPARQPAFANTCHAPQPVVTDLQLLDHVAKEMAKLVDEGDPFPGAFPWEDPDYVLVMKPVTPGLSERGIQIYWTDHQGRTRGPDGRVL